MKCPNCKVAKEYIVTGSHQYKRQYKRGSGYLKCRWCGEIITDEDFIMSVMNEYNLL